MFHVFEDYDNQLLPILNPNTWSIGYNYYGGINEVGQHLIGWFYMQVSWDDDYLEFDDPEIVKYYEFGEF